MINEQAILKATQFTGKDFVELAKGLSIPERTAKRYIATFYKRINRQGRYKCFFTTS